MTGRVVLSACLAVTYLTLYWLMLLPVAAPPVLTVTVRPRVAFAPSDIEVRVRIVPHPDNRSVSVSAHDESGMAIRSSGYTLDGAAAPLTQPPIWWHQMSAGRYDIAVTLYGSERIRAVVHATCELVGS